MISSKNNAITVAASLVSSSESGVRTGSNGKVVSLDCNVQVQPAARERVGPIGSAHLSSTSQSQSVAFSSPLLSPLFLSFLLPIRIILKMVRGRKGINGNNSAAATDSRSDSTATPPPRSILPITPTLSKDRDVVKVNNASLTELKNALDDAIKRVRSTLSRSVIA